MLAVILIQGFVSLGWLFFAAGAAPGITQGDQTTGPSILLAGGVSIAPIQGWQQEELPSENAGVRLTNGSGFLDAFFFSGGGSLEDLLNHYVDTQLLPAASSLQTSPVAEPLLVGPSISAVRATYIGTFNGVQFPIEGELTALVAPDGSGIVFDGWAQEGNLGYVLEDIRAMIQALEVS